MRNLIAAAVAALLVSACGGGDSAPAVVTTAPDTTTATESTPTPAPQAPQLEADAPNNNLDLATNANYATSTAATKCGYSVPSKVITGTVSTVHDGDTIKIGSTSIRLDSIDAPELTQTYGTQSRDNLAALVLNKQVTVYYSKLDKYDRTVGSVFTSDCTYANLQQVRSGSAWYYKQYQCEQPVSLRNTFAAAQAAAEAIDLGLWASTAMPPWVYRNGVDPVPPTCTGDSAVWTTGALPVTAPVTTPSTSTGTSTYTPTNGCFKVWVNGYRRANGTYVKGYYRNSPGCA